MAVTQYIGARYVPLFADPIDWDINSEYEPLTIVYYQGNSYTSKQSVPKGIDIANDYYWAITGNYNAQVEQYRREVRAFDGRITTNAQAIADEVTARMQADTAIRALITALDEELAAETSERETADTQIRADFAAADTQIRTDFAAADSALSTRIDGLSPVINARSPKRTGKKFLFFGDSWGQMQDQALYHRIVAINDFAFSKNFSVSGAQLEQINSQVDSATADSTFDNNDIDVIYVICGTNNVFWDNPISFEDALNAGNYLRNAFPNAEIHYFPNIARVYVNRSGRDTYMTMINGFCYESNIIAHTQQMSLLAYDSYSSYSGTDTYGVQHLSSSGCNNFAFWICALANGGDFDNYRIVADIPMQFTSESGVTGNVTLHTFMGTANSGAILIHAENLAWTAGHSESNPGTFQLEIPHTGASSFIVLPKFTQSGGVAFINTFTTAAYVCEDDGTRINLPIRGITPSTVDIYLPIASLFSWD